jgi:hypothetical protein
LCTKRPETGTKRKIPTEETKPTNQKSANNSDDLQHLLSILGDHPYMQEDIQLKGKPPCIIAYTSDQLQDLKNFCSTDAMHTSVIGVDCTFNLGAVYVTITVFHNNNLIRKTSHAAPIMMGPVYLHWDGHYQTYHSFFSHIQSHLHDIKGTEISGKQLAFGSDEEKAMTKALHHCFPDSKHILCTRHLDENVRRKLRHDIGASDSSVQAVINDIFGKSGLKSAENECDFDLQAMELAEKYADKIPRFAAYFSNQCLSNIKNYVWKPATEQFSTLNWTNNSCESMNNILKLSANWKALKLPELLEKLHQIVKLQYKDMRRNLHGQRNYTLASWTKKFQVSTVVWESKTEEKKEQVFQKLLRFTVQKPKTVTSSDGKLTITKTQTTARKPGQRTRVRNAKTTTITS